MKILIVEDEVRISSFVRKGLVEHGFLADVADNGNDGLHMASTGGYDAVVLDVMLPGRDGLSVLAELRRANNSVPVILLTARDGIENRVQGLNTGADDYMTKPFYVDELVARLHAVTRRMTGGSLSVVSEAGIVLNRMSREVSVNGNKAPLTAREFSLLEFLMRDPATVHTRTQILEKVWEYHFDPQTNIVDVYVQRVRARLAEAGAPAAIETVRGVGYRMRARAEATADA